MNLCYYRSSLLTDGSHNTSEIQELHSNSVDPNLVSYVLSALDGQDLRDEGEQEYEDSDT